MKPIYKWDAEKGIAEVTVFYDGNPFTGKAFCSPEDSDMKNRLVGFHIAEVRAVIKSLKFFKNVILKTELSTLEHYRSVIQRSKRLNPNGYELRMLDREIENVKCDIEAVKGTISFTSKELEEFINGKDALYHKIRMYRSQKDKQAEND